MDALPDDEDIAGAPSRKDDGRDAVSEARPGSFVDEAALEFANGHGGFAEDGREYVTVIRDGALPPLPWPNVVAHPDFCFTTTAAAGCYVWLQHSQRTPTNPLAQAQGSEPHPSMEERARREEGVR